MPDTPSPDQVPPAPAAGIGVPARNRLLIGATAFGLILLAIVLLTLPTGETGAGIVVAPAMAPPALATVTPPPVPPAADALPPNPEPPVAPPPAPVTATINAAAVPRTTAMRLDGKATTRRRFTVNVGRHILDVSQPGFLPRTDSVQLTAGQQFTWAPKLAVAPQPRGAAVPPSAETPPKRGNVDDAACRQGVANAAWHDAFASCTRAAEAGNAIAQRSIATMFQHGAGVNRSDDSAAHWFAEAARNGDTESMYQLAMAYERGRGVKKDQGAALDWYTRAGNAGQPDASFIVGDAYERGHLGAPKDKAKAIEWYRKAAAQGNKEAVNKVRDLTR